MPSSPRALLLVDPQASALCDAAASARPDLTLTAAASDTAARAYLGASSFDAVLVGAAMPEGTGDGLAALSGLLGQPTRIVEVPERAFKDWLDEAFPSDGPAEGQPAGAAAPSADGQAAVLASVSAELSRIAHALNNPLAVIDGNAQLALELARSLDVDPMVVSAIEDIQGGSRSLAALFSEVARLRERIDRTLG